MSEKIDSRDFRQATGRFATGITVVTVSDGDEVRGMTANSFVSVSLDPPLVLVSVANNAEMSGRIKRVGSYGISVLNEDQQPHSNLFAGAQIPDLEPSFRQIGRVPVLADSLSVFACDVYQEVVCGDHTLFVGLVREMEYCDAQPLLYFSGGYKVLGEVAEKDENIDLTAGDSAALAYNMGGYDAVGW